MKDVNENGHGRKETTADRDRRFTVLAQIGTASYRRRRLVVMLWIAVLVGLSLLGRAAGSQFKDSLNGGSTESHQAATFLESRFPSQAGDVAQIVFTSNRSVRAFEEPITRALDGIRSLPHVVSVRSPFAPGAGSQVSADAHVGYAVVQFNTNSDSLSNNTINAVVNRSDALQGDGLKVELAGVPIEKVEKPSLGKSEALGILAAAIILLFVFGSVIAMALPIVSAIVGVGATFGVLDVLSHGLTVPSFAPELAALVGLGVGIDYALFVVTRYRRALYAGDSPEDAVAVAMATSGRAVLFAGATVVLSLFGLFLLGLPFILGAALGAIFAVLFVVAASLTLLPAALGFAGTNIDRLHVGRRRRTSDENEGIWASWGRQIQRRPVVTGTAALLALVVLALPFFSLRLAFTDARTDPTSYTSRHAADLLAKGFGPGAIGPLVVAVDIPQPASAPAASELSRQLAGLPGVKEVSPPQFNAAKTAAVIDVIPKAGPQDAATATLVNTIRSSVAPQVSADRNIRLLVGGETAASIDTSNLISRHLGLVIGFVVGLSLIILAIAFRSIAIPIASALATLLSTAAAYGIVVTVFQWGWLGGAFDNHTTAPVDPWIPVMLFALLFGLSMDYQVFLVSRIREARLSGLSDTEAVTAGLATTGRVITSAALIMICVFGSFVLGDLRVLKVFGFAMAAAIFLDATLVRMVLMPAALRLIGKGAWWFPGPTGKTMPSPTVDVVVAPALAGSSRPLIGSTSDELLTVRKSLTNGATAPTSGTSSS